MSSGFSMDALMPAEIAAKAEQTGVKKANLDFWTMLALSILAGAFIALGAVFATTVSAGSSAISAADGTAAFTAALPYGVSRLLSGVAFSLGLIMVVVAGAELFTGNNLIVMAWVNRKVSTYRLLRNWVIVWVGNFIGAIMTAALMLATGQYETGSGSIGASALSTAALKTSHGFWQSLALGIMCNALVCMAVWMAYSARTTTSKIMAIVPPVTAFVAAGFEHSIANMYFIPFALFVKSSAPASFWTAIHKSAADFSTITWGNLFVKNLIPVTIGNIIGGAVMVGLAYWFVYTHPRHQQEARAITQTGKRAAGHDLRPKPAEE